VRLRNIFKREQTTFPPIDSKKIRIAFVDDQENDFFDLFKDWGYDVEHIEAVDKLAQLEQLANGRYQLIFLDIRGVGTALKMDGIGVLQHIKTRNPLVYLVVCSGARFDSNETRLIKEYSDDVIPKDTSAETYIGVVETAVRSVSIASYISALSNLGIEIDSRKISSLSDNPAKLSEYVRRQTETALDVNTSTNVASLFVNLITLITSA